MKSRNRPHLVWLVVAVAGCGGGDELGRYLDDPGFRRAALVDSLVNPANGYSVRRLARYEKGGAEGWARLAEWNPAVRPLMLGDLGGAAGALEAPLDVARARAGGRAGLVALGEQAFFRYPAQLLRHAALVLDGEAAARRYGLWIDGTGRVGGLVDVRFADGSDGLAMSCATCHAALDQGGRVVAGRPAARLDLGRLAADAAIAANPTALARLLAWGPGRVAVTSDDGSEPVALPDLRPVRRLTHLHRTASVRQRELASLAVRIETLIITAHGEVVRPPRAIALGLALYVWSLDAASVAVPDTGGRRLFDQRCAGCHTPPDYTGPPVALDVIATDRRLGEIRDRATGSWRVPSLRGVASRGLWLHDGSLPSLAALLDPTRLDAGSKANLRTGGPIPGHAFGIDLAADERAAIVDYLEAL